MKHESTGKQEHTGNPLLKLLLFELRIPARYSHRLRRRDLVRALVLATAVVLASGWPAGAEQARFPREVNEVAAPADDAVTAITDVRLIDGRGGAVVENATVLIRGNRIAAAGESAQVSVPADAHRVTGSGLTLVPGLMDAHFHIGGGSEGSQIANLFLRHGVTSVRDPGAWIEKYEPVIHSGRPAPRLFLTGPHFDTAPAAYPKNSILLNDPEESRWAVHRFADQGASAIKVYFRLPLGSIRAVCETAHQRGIPVTAHLELVHADAAILAGLDGIEHVTSVGTAIAPLRLAEQFRQEVTADNSARRLGRYKLWSQVDFEHPRVRKFIDLMAGQGTFFSVNLAVFERREGDKEATEVHVRGFANMMEFTRRAIRRGVRVVTGSHSWVPHAGRGWTYQREMELLVEAGMTPIEAISASTRWNAHFFRANEWLGTIEPGKLADLVLVEGTPDTDIRHMYEVRKVMLNGLWITLSNSQ